MESKLNHRAIENYSKAYSKKITDSYFSKNKDISGKEILSLTPTKQVNLFIIKNLFLEWKKEMNKLKSPYFNYEAEGVRKALSELMNELSRNIRITRGDFEPLIERSVIDTLLLIFSPYDFYARKINDHTTNEIRISYFEEFKKYVKINVHLLDAIIGRFGREGIKQASREEAFKLFQEALQNVEDPPDDVTPFLEEFSKVVNLDTDKFYNSYQARKEPAKESLDNSQPDTGSVNEKFNEPRATLHDRLSENLKSTLADTLQSQKIGNLKEFLTVNQKFMFINKLFGGNSAVFHKTLDRIEEFENKNEAISFINETVTHARDWDYESEEVLEFMALLDRKFK